MQARALAIVCAVAAFAVPVLLNLAISGPPDFKQATASLALFAIIWLVVLVWRRVHSEGNCPDQDSN